MKYEQIANLVNKAYKQTTGQEGVLELDLHNVVDTGKNVLDNTDVNVFMKNLINLVGEQVIVARAYKPAYPDILRRQFEYGSILEKICLNVPVSEDDPSVALKNGDDVDQFKVVLADPSVKLFNGSNAKQITQTIVTDRLRDSFLSAEKLNAFISAIFLSIQNRIEIDNAELVMSTINNFTGAVLQKELAGVSATAKSTTKAVNLLKLYNSQFGANLTKDKALTTPEFLRFSALILNNYKEYLAQASTLYNLGGKVRFTPSELLHVVMLSEFKNAFSIYLQSDVFHKELVTLPLATSVVDWQGTGTNTDASFSERSKINLKVNDGTKSGKTISQDGIVAVMFDHEAVGVYNEYQKVTSAYNANGDYTNYFYKYKKSFYNDFDENFVVFFIA